MKSRFQAKLKSMKITLAKNKNLSQKNFGTFYFHTRKPVLPIQKNGKGLLFCASMGEGFFRDYFQLSPTWSNRLRWEKMAITVVGQARWSLQALYLERALLSL